MKNQMNYYSSNQNKTNPTNDEDDFEVYQMPFDPSFSHFDEYGDKDTIVFGDDDDEDVVGDDDDDDDDDNDGDDNTTLLRSHCDKE